MTNKINSLLDKITLKYVFFFTLVFILTLYIINISAIGMPRLLKVTNGHTTLDFEFGYSLKTAYSILSSLTAKGREIYMYNIIPLDFFFPITYMLFFVSWTTYLIHHHNFLYKSLLIFPIFAMIFDWIENIGAIILLSYYPNLPLWAVQIASIAGIVKMLFIFGGVGTIIILLLNKLIKKYKNKNIKQENRHE